MLHFTIILAALQWAGIPGAAPAHDLKLSVCEIEYHSETQTCNLTFFLFQDDLKEALYADPFAPRLEQKDVEAYILKRFEWQLNGKKQEMRFHSLREKNDQIAVQFTSAKTSNSDISEMYVKNTLLVEQFRAQVNMVYAIFPAHSKKVQMLTATKTEGRFSF
jgi:hypothetical protein